MEPLPPRSDLPTRRAAAVHQLKASLLQLNRTARDLCDGVRRHPCAAPAGSAWTTLESRTPLWTDEALAERRLQRGKVHNLRAAARRLDGVQIPAGGLFSFWKQLGRATASRGFVAGRELREGCLIPAIGGGLCQLSGALYDLALQSGCEIAERHAHSRTVPGSAAARGRDATIAWNYIDLRFRPDRPLRIEVELTADTLVVRFRFPGVAPPRAAPVRAPLVLLAPTTGGCDTCGQSACFRHERERPDAEPTAFLVYETRPEWRAFVSGHRHRDDALLAPIDGRRSRLSRFVWDTPQRHFALTTLAGSLAVRRARRGGPAAVRAAQLAAAERLAARYGRWLRPEHTHVVVDQELLPFLWRDGWLGGRTFTVLLGRLPLRVLHDRLDEALARFPERRLLGDFRAPEGLVAAEADALAAAQRVVTAHPELASLFPGRVESIDWATPRSVLRTVPGRRIAFPGPTAARKGAFEVRAAARALDLEVVLLGRELEGAAFWDGVRTVRRAASDPGALADVAAVVQPSLFEPEPRLLLSAHAAGIPVVATAGCGLPESPTVRPVGFGDAAALQAALSAVLY